MIFANFKKILFLSVFIPSFTFASMVASVVKLRGNVTKLLPHSLVASSIKIGDKLPEDTSIVTAEKSFVKIVFNDNSQVSLGPNSKLVISELQKSEANVISLLKGRLRSQVERKNNDTNKLFIQTRTAALGVRGTDFQAIYNPENNVTNLLTFKGKVAMVKIDEEMQKEMLKEKMGKSFVEDRDARGDVRIYQEKMPMSASSEQLEKMLQDQKVVEVEKGQFSGVSDSLERATEPVRISPVQFSALYQNIGLMDKKEGPVKEMKSSDMASIDMMEQAPQKAPAEGFFDEVSGKMAPKSGGLIDLDSGVYVPPTKDAPFDQKMNVYMVDNLGRVDKNSGDFMAPKGLKLDAVKGFVPMKNEETLVAMSNNLNDNTNMKIWRPADNKEELAMDRESYLTARESFSKGHLIIRYLTGGQKLSASSSNKFTPFEKDTNSYSGLNIQIHHSTDEKWKLINEIGYRSVDFNNIGNGFVQNSEGLFTIGIGVKKYLNERWNFVSRLSLEQEFFFNVTTANNVDSFSLKKITLFKWRNYIEGDLFQWKRFSISSLGGLLFIPKKETSGVASSTTVGLNLGLGAKFWMSSKHYIAADINVESYSHDFESNSFSSEQDHEQGVFSLGYARLF